jgi:hypothetical protein
VNLKATSIMSVRPIPPVANAGLTIPGNATDFDVLVHDLDRDNHISPVTQVGTLVTLSDNTAVTYVYRPDGSVIGATLGYQRLRTAMLTASDNVDICQAVGSLMTARTPRATRKRCIRHIWYVYLGSTGRRGKYCG